MGKKKILLVDDSKTVLLVESMALKTGAYEVITAGDGEECLAKVAAEAPDLILLDLVMPRLDGFETCRRLRANPATRSVPIIIVTTRGETQNREAGYAAGCNDFVTKPVNAGELLAKIRGLVGE